MPKSVPSKYSPAKTNFRGEQFWQDNYAKIDPPNHFCYQNRSGWTNFASQNWCFFAKFCPPVKYNLQQPSHHQLASLVLLKSLLKSACDITRGFEFVHGWLLVQSCELAMYACMHATIFYSNIASQLYSQTLQLCMDCQLHDSHIYC